MEPILCRYCGVEWDYKARRFAHREDCYILTGVQKVLGRLKKRAPPEPVKPVEDPWADE